MPRDKANPQNVVVFDLDETLGYFQEIAVFHDIMSRYIRANNETRQGLLHHLFDLCPEYFRPNIMDVLFYLKKKKQSGECSMVMIYTNNQGAFDWTDMIMAYLHKKLNYPLFDHVVKAFKINGQVVEVCRRTHEKTTKDLLRCAKLPANSQICFIDDNQFKHMNDVYYIKVHPYVHNLSFHVVTSRLFSNNLFRRTRIREELFIPFFNRHVGEYKTNYEMKPDDEYEIDIIITKRLQELLSAFFE